MNIIHNDQFMDRINEIAYKINLFQQEKYFHVVANAMYSLQKNFISTRHLNGQ